MNRRDAIKLGAATATTLLAGDVLAQGKSLRVLILGGTGFIGPHFVEVLRTHGHKLTLFNRGKRNPGLFPDVEALTGDRNGQLEALEGRDWDVVIDNSGYRPREVKLTADLLKDHVQHYLYISSISAYADLSKPGIDEDYPLARLRDPTVEEITNETYGGLKAACEQVVEQTYGKRCTIIRPSYIVGPGDSTDRFTYWPVRTARGGEMLAPGTASDPVQFIDVRDLADFVSRCVERNIGGRYNLCNQPRSVSMGNLLETSRRVSGSDAKFVWVSQQFLEAQKVLESGEIPIWAPSTGEFAGIALVSPARALAKGLRLRDIRTTVADTLAWHAKRPAEQQQKLKAGLTPEREAELLKLWRAASKQE